MSSTERSRVCSVVVQNAQKEKNVDCEIVCTHYSNENRTHDELEQPMRRRQGAWRADELEHMKHMRDSVETPQM